MVRDPSGFSFYVPMQFRLDHWNFIVSPEFMYTLAPLDFEIETGDFDFLFAMRWGMSYTSSFFELALSSALYLPSYQGNHAIVQLALEGSFYIPDSPMYINLLMVTQRIQGNENADAYGLNMGFLF